jgi:hypothetical protein
MQNKTCNNCFFKQSKMISLNGEIPAWCWRFDHETDHNGYCNDDYFINKNAGKKKFNNMNPKIAGYIKRKRDFDKGELNKLLLSGGLGIIGVVIGTLLGYML